MMLSGYLPETVWCTCGGYGVDNFRKYTRTIDTQAVSTVNTAQDRHTNSIEVWVTTYADSYVVGSATKVARANRYATGYLLRLQSNIGVPGER